MTTVQKPKVFTGFTLPLTILLIVTNAAGVFISSLYDRDSTLLAAQIIGQDYFSLAVTIPVLVISAILIRRGSRRAQLVWLGTAFYLVYTYLIYAFCLQYNALFLVYVALLGFSIYGLIFGMANTDFAKVKAQFSPDMPVRVFSIAMGIVPLLFYPMHFAIDIPAMTTSQIPQGVIDLNLPVDFTHVIDMAIYLPAAGIGAIFLWQRKPVGYVIAGVMLTVIAMMMFALLAMFASMGQYGLAVATKDWVIISSVAGVYSGLFIWYLRLLKTA